jgi:glycosyltransferase involved in cell wall biosynthesis/predicted SAM-dependent methyltransferase
MRIVIDMQGAQTESRFRGIGRYTMSLAQSIVKNRGGHEVIVALSGLFPDMIEPIRAAFDGMLPQENIRVWYAPGPVRECEPGNEWRRSVAELIRETFIFSLRPDVVLVSSLFEGYCDDAVTSIGRFDKTTQISVVLYDLIPLLNPDHYLKPNPAYEQHYRRKFEHLRRASFLLAISESSRQEGLTHLGVAADSVVNISTAIDECFSRVSISEDQARLLREKFGILRPFVLYTGCADERKNLPRLIKAYAGLSAALRASHQLVFAGKMSEGEVARFRAEAKSAGLRIDELCFTGYVSDDELIQLCNLCKLFVFPSWHEGFGLPALEAMACGTAVIGANTSSVSEVIGRADALFDPRDVSAISSRMAQVLEDESFRAALAAHGLEQAKQFSWDESGRRAIAAFEHLYEKKGATKASRDISARRLKLAYVSPLPPERSGIADYSAELLPELAKHYDIEVVVAQKQIGDAWVQANCPIRDAQWLRAHGHQMDRVLYQVGNSPFHQHMLPLLEEVPGVVVMHDFFLSGMLSYLEEEGIVQHAWARALYHSHGYSAVRERYQTDHTADIKVKYPVNLDVLQLAQGVIVHSEYSRKLAADWLGKDFSADWKIIPHLRTPSADFDRAQARATLGLEDDDFVVCSFGFLDPTKLNHRLLEAWLHSRLGHDAHCVLVFAGENHGGEYGAQLQQTIRTSGLNGRIRITGWADMPAFRNYLAAADMAVQLRTLSRGETSGTVLDCMNHALPIIVNANGSLTDLPIDAVWMLPDVFEDHQLVEALEALWQDTQRRVTLGKRAKEVILTRHAPHACAEQYAEAIEQFHAGSQVSSQALTKAIAALDSHQPIEGECRIIAQDIAQSLPVKQPVRQLLLDISATCRTDLRTGIERVARALIMAMLESPPAGYRVEPVYLSNEGGAWHYRYACRYMLDLLECPLDALVDEVVEPRNGDVLLGLDLSGQMLIEAEAAGLFTHFRNIGVAVHFIVFDLLPIQMPQFFPPGTDASHAKWLQTIAKFDGAVCISHAVADELRVWMTANDLQRQRPFRIGWFHLGVDMKNSVPSSGLPGNAESVLSRLAARPSFLMVGTIEPRKGYLQTLEAFSQLWVEGLQINLVIVGKEGWKGLSEDMRRTIPVILKRLRHHPELGKRMFWLEDVSDEYLEKIYTASTCLIAASEGEGFGLPLIEAAQHKLPIIARDIPVFREVAGEHAFYFKGTEPDDLATALKVWVTLNAGSVPISKHIEKMKWRDSARQLYRHFDPDVVERQAMRDHLFLIHGARLELVQDWLPAGERVLDLGGANAPLHKMGYPHRFSRMTIIDLPSGARHDYYKDVVVDRSSDKGEVVVHYCDMTYLDSFADGSIDLVWSGQSIEHVPPEAGKRMCREAYRVLRNGGAFCLDTPNRLLTAIHTNDVGGELVHPEHCIEYTPQQLRKVLEAAGFHVVESLGICEMSETVATGKFHYADFFTGRNISENVDSSYIQYFHCVKP